MPGRSSLHLLTAPLSRLRHRPHPCRNKPHRSVTFRQASASR